MTTETVDSLYGELAEVMSSLMPKTWTSAWIDARLLDDFGEAQLYSRDSKGRTTEVELTFDSFEKVEAALRKLRDLMKQPDRPAWTKAKITLERTGAFHIDFDYQST